MTSNSEAHLAPMMVSYMRSVRSASSLRYWRKGVAGDGNGGGWEGEGGGREGRSLMAGRGCGGGKGSKGLKWEGEDRRWLLVGGSSYFFVCRWLLLRVNEASRHLPAPNKTTAKTQSSSSSLSSMISRIPPAGEEH